MINLLNDEPTLFDELERARLVRHVGDAIATCRPPQVFGVHGDWGSGKTSFLQQLQWYLCGTCPELPDLADEVRLNGLLKGHWKQRVTVVWFEAWRYQHERAPIVALLQEIRTQLPWTAKALQESRKLGEVAIRSALLSLEDLTKRIGIQASKIQEVGERWEEANLATRLPSHMIRQHLEQAMKTLLGRQKKDSRRLVVLVDDLDRCESETAYQLLEGIKIYLNLPSCVFVLGMNQRVVETAVAKRLPQSSEGDGQGRRQAKEYLEKLCQNVWHLSPVRDPATLLRRYLGGLAGAEEISALAESHRCLPPVPRKIKGYANLLLRFHEHIDQRRSARSSSDDQRWAQLVLAFTYLYHFQHRLYRLLWSDGREFWDELLKWCSSEPASQSAEAHLQEFLRRKAPGSSVGDRLEPSEREPTPAQVALTTVFHDPAADNILHIEELVREVGPITETEASVHLLP